MSETEGEEAVDGGEEDAAVQDAAVEDAAAADAVAADVAAADAAASDAAAADAAAADATAADAAAADAAPPEADAGDGGAAAAAAPSPPRPAGRTSKDEREDDVPEQEEEGAVYNKMSRSAVRPEPINSEFLYYSATLKEAAPRLTSEADRQKVIPWLRKLLRPEYHSTPLREKRNRYLLALTVCVLADEVTAPFTLVPPSGALPELGGARRADAAPAQWELDEMWTETLEQLPAECRRMPCSVHGDDEDACRADSGASCQLERALDETFMLMLFLARPYAIMMREPEQRSLVAAWLQVLCTVATDSCRAMKTLRNDYLMALLGYVQDLRVDGPFVEPPVRPLRPLDEAADLAAAAYAPIDPGGKEFCDFLRHQPVPDEGAFCYLAVTGELLNASLQDGPQ